MPASSQILSMGQQFSGLPMGALIGGPLQSAAQANQQMAMTQLEFLMTTCFKPTGGEQSSYDPIMIEMTLERGVISPPDPSGTGDDKTTAPSISTVTTSFKLPLLTIIPLNSLAVDDVKVDFEMEVKSSFAQNNSSKESSQSVEKGGFSGGGSIGPFHVEVHGSVSHSSSSQSASDTHYRQSNSAKYDVSVHAGQLPLPQGVKTIIDAYSKNVSPVVIPTEDAAKH